MTETRSELQIDPVEILKNPQVRSYLVGILSSELPAEVKYQRILDLFQRERQIRDRVIARLQEKSYGSQDEIAANIDGILAGVMQELRLWDPQRISQEIAGSIRRAIQWLKTVQNADGGWTILGEEQSLFWETAFSALCLSAAARSTEGEFAGLGAEAALTGVEWLNRNLGGWSYDYPQNELMPVYNVALAVICYHEIGPESFSPEYASRVEEGLRRLVQARCPDGGWRSRAWESWAVNPREGSLSEPGATSLGLRACSLDPYGQRYRPVLEEALECLLGLRNADGCWNGLDNRPSVSKTCDGLLGVLAAQEAGVANPEIEPALERAANWLQSQEKPVLRDGVVEGWGWDYLPELVAPKVFEAFILARVDDPDDLRLLRDVYTLDEGLGKYRVRERLGKAEKDRLVKVFVACGYGYDYIGTCLTVEALVRLGESLPALVSNCKWLIENQSRSQDPRQNGGWVTSTARIALALLEVYKRLRAQEPVASVRTD